MPIVIESKILHDLKELLHQDGSVELRLRKHLEQVSNLDLLKVVNAQIPNTLDEALRVQQLIGFTLDFSREDVLLQYLSDSYLLLEDFVCNSDKDLLGNVDHFIFIDFHRLLGRVRILII